MFYLKYWERVSLRLRVILMGRRLTFLSTNESFSIFKQYFEFFSSFVIRRAYASQSWCLHIQKCGQQHSKLKKKYCFNFMNINHEKVDYDVLQTARLTIWSTSFVISLWGLVLFWSTFSKSNAFVLSKALVNSSKNEKKNVIAVSY